MKKSEPLARGKTQVLHWASIPGGGSPFVRRGVGTEYKNFFPTTHESARALAAIYRCRHKDGGLEFTLAEAKIRNELAAAKLREVTISQKLEELVPASISRMAINAFINHVRCKFDELRRRGAIDHEWINACGRRFAEILADLVVQHGLEFAKATLKPEDVQTLRDRGFPEQPSQDQSQP